MSVRRFMINSRSIRNGYASFDGDLFNHMVRVLRLGTGAAVTMVDERGRNTRAGSTRSTGNGWLSRSILCRRRPNRLPDRG